MRKRTLALILSLAMLVGLVSATGLFSAAAAEDAQWKADETGKATFTTIARNTELTAYMKGQGVTESALNYHMNPLSVYGEDGKTRGRQDGNVKEPNGLTRALCDGDIGSNEGFNWNVPDKYPWASRRIVYFCDAGKMNYFTYDLQQNSRLTDFVVAGSQLDETAYLLKNVKIYVSDTKYEGTAATLGTEVFSHMGESSANVNDYNYHVRLSQPVEGRYVTFALGVTADSLMRLGELAAYGTRLTYDAKGNAVRELRAAQDIPTYDNALKNAVGKQIDGTSGIPLAGNLVDGVVSALTTNVDYLVTGDATSTYKNGDALYEGGSNFLGKANGKAWLTVDSDSYTVQNIPLTSSKYTETVTDGDNTETTVTKYKRYIKANIGWGGTRIGVRKDNANEDRNQLESANKFYYDLGGTTDVEKVMVASGVALNAPSVENVTSEVSDGALNSWNGQLEESGKYIVSGIKLYVADTLDELKKDGTFLETALVADFTQGRNDDMDTAVELTLQNVKGRYIGFELTNTGNKLRLSELAVKIGEKHGNWPIAAASVTADMAAKSLLNTVTVVSTNIDGDVSKLGDGDGRTKAQVYKSDVDGKNDAGEEVAYIPGTETVINGTTGWSKIRFELDSEVSIDSFLVMGSLADDDKSKFNTYSTCMRNRTIAYYRIYVSDSKDDLFNDDKMVVDCNNLGSNAPDGSQVTPGASEAFCNYLNAPATGRFIGLLATTGAYNWARVGEFHVYGKPVADVKTWNDCSSSEITVPTVEDNLLAGVYKNVTAYEQHYLKAGQDDELAEWNPWGVAAHFDNVFDGKVWAGSSNTQDDANSKWTPVVYDADANLTKYPNYIWLDFDLGVQYNIDTFLHAAADRGANTVDFFVTDKSVAELVESKAEPNVHMIGETAGQKGIATWKKLNEPAQGSHVIVRLKGNFNAGNYQMWVSELAVSGTAASPLDYNGAAKRLEDSGLRFSFDVAVKGAAYENGNPQESNNYSRDISKATVTVDGTSYPVEKFGAIVSIKKAGWEADLASVEAVEENNRYTKVVEANNLYAVQRDYVTYTAVVTDIPAAAKDREIHARPYVAYKATDGSIQYIYGKIESSSVAAFGDIS